MPRNQRKERTEHGENTGPHGEESMAPLPLARAPEFHKDYVTKTISFITDFDIRVVVANEAMETDERWCTVADGMLILTPVAAKELAGDLQAAVQSWEELNGKIKGRTKHRVLAEFKREGD